MSSGPDVNERTNVLLVDDRLNNLVSLKALLDRPEYNLVLAQSGAEALDQVLEKEFALVLMDIGMPEMDGFEAASIMRQREKSRYLPIIFVTASIYDLDQSALRGYGVGAADYLTKPLVPEVVQSKVAVFVQLYRQRKLIETQSARLKEAELREQRLLREKAEAALEESAALYQLTFDEAPLGVGHATPDGRWVKANPSLLELLGQPEAALVGRPIVEMVEAGEQPLLEDGLRRLREGEGRYAGEHRIATARPAPLWVDITLAPLRAPPDATMRQIIVVVNDTSERKLIELERVELVATLQEGIRGRDDFLSLVAHELKTPVTPLRLQVASLLREADKDPQALSPGLARRLRAIDSSTERVEALVDRLIDVSALIAGELALKLEEVDLGELARAVVLRLEPSARRLGSSIAIRTAPGIIGRWDRRRLTQVLGNLIDNALKFGAGKPVEVEVAAGPQVARLTVRDSGIGIAEPDQEEIFNQFGRVAPVRNFGGFGLGLWTVRRIVEAHGGTVAVRRRPTQGTDFLVELPLHLHAALAEEAPR